VLSGGKPRLKTPHDRNQNAEDRGGEFAEPVKALTQLLLPSLSRSLRTDLSNADAKWEDRTVVRDGRPQTFRKPHDLPSLCSEILQLFSEFHRQPAARRLAAGLDFASNY
jgi:hypothetical protein